jgi:hypothetical protein
MTVGRFCDNAENASAVRCIFEASPPYLLGAGALVCFALGVYFAATDKKAQSAFFGTFFFLCVVLAYFPTLDSIKAFGVEAQAKKTLDQANDLLERLRVLALIQAQVTYKTLGWANRMGGMPNAEKQEIVNGIGELLKSDGISESDIKLAKAEYVSLIGYDLSIYFEMALGQYVISVVGKKDEAAMTKWSTAWNAAGRLSPAKVAGFDGTQLVRALKAEIPRELVAADDARKLEQFADLMGKIFDGCIHGGGYTTEANNFFDEYAPLAGDPLLKHVLK